MFLDFDRFPSSILDFLRLCKDRKREHIYALSPFKILHLYGRSSPNYKSSYRIPVFYKNVNIFFYICHPTACCCVSIICL